MKIVCAEPEYLWCYSISQHCSRVAAFGFFRSSVTWVESGGPVRLEFLGAHTLAQSKRFSVLNSSYQRLKTNERPTYIFMPRSDGWTGWGSITGSVSLKSPDTARWVGHKGPLRLQYRSRGYKTVGLRKMRVEPMESQLSEFFDKGFEQQLDKTNK